MSTITKLTVQRILAQKLNLHEPRFVLEKSDKRIMGSVISSSFKGKTDLRRQQLIRDALDEALGIHANGLVGMVLAYTPEEWDIDLEADVMAKAGK